MATLGHARFWEPDPTFAAQPDVPGAAARFRLACRNRWGLGPAQADILYQAARGLTSIGEIGAALGKAPQTVTNNLTAAYRRLGLRGRVEGGHLPRAVVLVWPLYLATRLLARWAEG
jgi:DNA-binding CsgD family transcriptional regulator